jgi:hypothetical protein
VCAQSNLNAIAYATTPAVRQHWGDLFQALWADGSLRPLWADGPVLPPGQRTHSRAGAGSLLGAGGGLREGLLSIEDSLDDSMLKASAYSVYSAYGSHGGGYGSRFGGGSGGLGGAGSGVRAAGGGAAGGEVRGVGGGSNRSGFSTDDELFGDMTSHPLVAGQRDEAGGEDGDEDGGLLSVGVAPSLNDADLGADLGADGSARPPHTTSLGLLLPPNPAVPAGGSGDEGASVSSLGSRGAWA